MDAERPDQQLQDEGTRFWREEREEGAIYNAYLKKVTYLSQARLEDENEKKREFSHLMWETHKVKAIKAGTLDKLVESLTNGRGEMDSSYVNIFLATYRTFATPKQVLETWIHQYKEEAEQTTREDKTEMRELQLGALKAVLFVWLDTYPEDFRESPDYPCLHLLESFSRDYTSGSGICRKVQEKLQAYKQEDAELEASRNEFAFSLQESYGHPVDTDSSKSQALLEISCRKIAEQLTCKDANLFKKVVPHHCLGAVWSHRDKEGAPEAPSIQATIQQFNRISLRVIATVLKTEDLKTSVRAKILHKWICIAQDLRELKNFSSLKAIITGLQSHAVYRLGKTWSALSKDTLRLFEELSEIFSVENNQLNSRELLMKEATAKFPDLDSQSKSLKRKNLQKRRSWIDNGIVQGTVPYLGTFLTDLTMIDTAMPDVTEDGLINFEKRRKEFEVLAQLKLLQSAASIYTIKEDDCFWRWFNSIRVYSDMESHSLSCAIEPVSETSAKIKKKSASINGTPFKRRVSASKLYACFACSSRFSEPILSSSSNLRTSSTDRKKRPFCLGAKTSKSDASKLGLFARGVEERNSIASIPDTIAASIGPLAFKTTQPTSLKHELSHSSSTSSVISSDSDTGPPHTPFKSSDSYVIKVSMSSSQNDIAHVYKSIMLMNSDHTHTVVEKILEKYGHEGNPDDFCLIQILPDGELLIPDRANVFYALNNAGELKFVLKSRAEYQSQKDRRKGARRRLKKLTA